MFTLMTITTICRCSGLEYKSTSSLRHPVASADSPSCEVDNLANFNTSRCRKLVFVCVFSYFGTVNKQHHQSSVQREILYVEAYSFKHLSTSWRDEIILSAAHSLQLGCFSAERREGQTEASGLFLFSEMQLFRLISLIVLVFLFYEKLRLIVSRQGSRSPIFLLF